jgi:hypothetical protein
VLAILGVGGVAQLHEHRLALARPLDGRGEEAVRTVGDGGLHALADDLGYEHAGAEAALGLDGGPLEVIVVDVLGIAEGAGGDLELCGMAPPVGALIELVRMHRFFDTYRTGEKAIAAFRPS